MWTRPVTVAEIDTFIRQSENLWTDKEKLSFVDFIARNPETGDLIPETGGVRRVRWSRQRHWQAWWYTGDLLFTTMRTPRLTY